jgi:hypothetical protein
MKIEVLYLEGCPNYLPAIERLRAVLRQEGLTTTELLEIEVRDEPAAQRLKFCGSPTIRVNGADIDANPSHIQEPALSCRLYEAGAPSEEMIRVALRKGRE